MIKEIILFVILFQSFYALETTEAAPENIDNSTHIKFEKCHKEKDGHLLLSKDRLCIPGGNLTWKIQLPPYNKVIRNKIDVKMSHAQIIEIDAHTLTITVSLDLGITWDDHRLQLATEKAFEVVYLSANDEKEIWSPQIVVRSNMVAQDRQGEEIALTRRCGKIECLHYRGGITGTKNVQLTTKIRCEMDFQTFPFDKHICNIEVSTSPKIYVIFNLHPFFRTLPFVSGYSRISADIKFNLASLYFQIPCSAWLTLAQLGPVQLKSMQLCSVKS